MSSTKKGRTQRCPDLGAWEQLGESLPHGKVASMAVDVL